MNYLKFKIYKPVKSIYKLGQTPLRLVDKVLGGGPTGSGVATALTPSNYQVILKEVNEKFLRAGIDRIKGEALGVP